MTGSVATRTRMKYSRKAPRSVSEIIAYAKSNPVKLNYASVGAGSPQHVSADA